GLLALYGASSIPEEDQVYVHTDGSCSDPTVRARARAGSGVCWGLGCKRNASYRVPGRQTSPRAELYAVGHAVKGAPSARPLHIRTDSEYAIHVFCHWAADFAECGWQCENADVITSIVAMLASREAPTRLSWVKGHSGNVLNEEADRLAARGA
ncbi:ribonuclease H-like protein, partial [Auricularia subglabra TFB-10046 SS5]